MPESLRVSPAATLPLSPLDPVAARRRAVWVASLAFVAAVAVFHLGWSWLPRAGVLVAGGETVGRALGRSLSFETAVELAFVLFAGAEAFRAALSLARAGRAAGLAMLAPPTYFAHILLPMAFGAASAGSAGPEVRLLAAPAAVVWAGALRACGIGRGAALLACACATPIATAIADRPLAWLLGGAVADAAALALTAAARRASVFAVSLGALYIGAVLWLVGSHALYGRMLPTIDEALLGLAGLALWGIAYGVRLWPRRSRR